MKYIKKILFGLLIVVLFGFGSNISINSMAISEDIFTQEELDFIAANPVIQIGVDRDFAPFEFIDTDGEYKGICADYVELIELKSGLTFEVKHPELFWSDTYTKAVDKELDVLPCIGVTTERESIFGFSEPYIDFQRAIFTKRAITQEYDIEDLSDLRVGVQINSGHYSYLISETDILPSTYSDIEAGLNALSQDEIDVYIGNLATTAHIIKSKNITNISVNSILDSDQSTLAFAVNPDKPLLLSIIDKSLATITVEERLEISDRWILVDQTTDFGQMILIIVFIILGVIALSVFAGYWINKLRKLIHDRDQEIENRKKIEKELILAKHTAEEATRAKSDFVANMSHEIRTPMNAVLGIMSLLEMTELTVKQKDYLRRAKSSAEGLLGIINDILDFSKIEAGKLKLEEAEFNLDRLIEAVITSVGLKAFQKGVEIINYRDNLCPNLLVGDQLRIGQVILNLLGNAVKFTEKGEIIFETKMISKSKDKVTIEFSCTDTGIGIDNKRIEMLFSAFEQADSTTTRKFGGTGLGLSISTKLVESMGSKLQVESTLGKGSKFFFVVELPYLPEIEVKNNILIHELSRINALVVDDNEVALDACSNMLDSLGIPHDCVQTGEEAVELVSSKHNIVILDYKMPHMNGLETFKKIKEKMVSDMPAVILLTAYEKDFAESKEDISEINVVLMKPLNGSSLFDAIVNSVSDKYNFDVPSKIKTRLDVKKETLKGNILVVEDNEVNQLVVQELLESHGLMVTIAQNGRECVNILNKPHDFDLVLMDLQMPVMDGYEATITLRNEGKNIPIIALSADILPETKKRVLEVGMNAFLSKPIIMEDLLNEIIKYTGKEIVLDDTLTNESGKILNISRFDTENALHRIGNNQKLYIHLLTQYAEMSKGFCEKMSTLFHEGNIQEMLNSAHSLKGVAANIGSIETYQLIIDLERMLKGEEIVLTDIIPSIKKSLKLDTSVINQLKDHEPKTLEAIFSTDELIEELNTLLDGVNEFEIGNIIEYKNLIDTLQYMKIEDADTLSNAIVNRKYGILTDVINKILKILSNSDK